MSDIGPELISFLMKLPREGIPVKIHGMNEKGQITFSFSLSSISDKTLATSIAGCDSLLKTLGQFYCDIVGGLVVRNNLDSFFKFFLNMSDSDYGEKVLKYDHVHFGIASSETTMTMMFHCSLLYDIFIRLLENCQTGSMEAE